MKINIKKGVLIIIVFAVVFAVAVKLLLDKFPSGGTGETVTESGVQAQDLKKFVIIPKEISRDLSLIRDKQTLKSARIKKNPGRVLKDKRKEVIPVIKLAKTPIVPDKAFLGETLDVVIRDEKGQFSPEETTSVDFGMFVEVNSFRVDSPTQISANIMITEHMPYSTTVSVKVTTAGKEKICGRFSIIIPHLAPVIERIEPEPGKPGELVTIHGKNFATRSLNANHIYFNDMLGMVQEAELDKMVVFVPMKFRGGKVIVVVIGEDCTEKTSNSVNYTVTNLPKLNTIEFGQTIEGEILDSEFFDRYIFEAIEGTIATIIVNRVANLPNGEGSLNPMVMLEDKDRRGTVAWDDDSGTDIPPGPGNNALIQSVVLAKTGTYVILINAGTGYESGEEIIRVKNGDIITDFSKLRGLGPYKLTLIKEDSIR